MKHVLEKAFTLVELLIVIGIIGVLAVTVLVNLNPGEAQKKARDAQRIKNLTDLQAAIELYLAEGNTIAAGALKTTATSNTTQVTCANSWLFSLNLCNYIKAIPIDPRQGRTTSVVGTPTTWTAKYCMERDLTGRFYKLATRLESTDNLARVQQDGGNNQNYFEVFNLSTLAVCN